MNDERQDTPLPRIWPAAFLAVLAMVMVVALGRLTLQTRGEGRATARTVAVGVSRRCEAQRARISLAPETKTEAVLRGEAILHHAQDCPGSAGNGNH